MPVRIYDIAKEVGLENKEVLVKAKELGIAAAKVPSSSLDKITAEFLIEQLGGKKVAAAPPPPPTPPVVVVAEAPPTPPPPAPPAPEVAAPAPAEAEIVPSAPVAEVKRTMVPSTTETPAAVAPPA